MVGGLQPQPTISQRATQAPIGAYLFAFSQFLDRQDPSSRLIHLSRTSTARPAPTDHRRDDGST